MQVVNSHYGCTMSASTSVRHTLLYNNDTLSLLVQFLLWFVNSLLYVLTWMRFAYRINVPLVSVNHSSTLITPRHLNSTGSYCK